MKKKSGCHYISNVQQQTIIVWVFLLLFLMQNTESPMPPPAPPLPQIHSLSVVLHFWQRENKCDKEINNIAGLLSLFDTHIQSKSTDFFFLFHFIQCFLFEPFSPILLFYASHVNASETFIISFHYPNARDT